jgi:hypothetical protein
VIEFLATNWLWIAAIGFFVAMHRGGHGCGTHGGHGGHQHTAHEHTDHQNRPAERADTDRSAT